MRNRNTRTRIAMAIMMIFLAAGSIAATSFHLGGGYSYTMFDNAFDSPLDSERIMGKGIEHEATINTATYLGRTNSFGLGLDFNFRIPMRNTWEGLEDTELLPWGIGANLTLVNRVPFTKSSTFGMHTKLGGGMTYRSSNANTYPVIHEGADKIQDLDTKLLTGIGFYADIAERVSITAGIDFNVSLARFYKASGTRGDEVFKTPNWVQLQDVIGHETRGYVTISYIFTNRD